MNIENLTTLSFSIAFALFMILLTGSIIGAYILSRISEKKYKRAIIKLILEVESKTDNQILESIKNTYDNYRINGSFSYLSIFDINAKLIAELREGTYKKYSKIVTNVFEKDIYKLECLNKSIKDEFFYSDEKLNSLLADAQSLSLDKQKVEYFCGEVKLLFGSIYSFCDGRIFEKQCEIKQKENEISKLKTSRWFNRLGWIVGVISGIITIITFLL